MNLKDILVISGMPGMYKYVSQGRHGMIVEGLADGKRFNVPVTAKVSALEDISVFTEDEDVPLAEVFRNIYRKENGAASIPHKSPDLVLKDYFGQVLPSYDRSRVYVSDMRKIVSWYNTLQAQDLVDLEEPAAEEGADGDEAAAPAPAAEG